MTIKEEKIEEDESEYRLDFPNYEVKSGFLGNLLEVYSKKDISEVQTLRTKLIKALRNKDGRSLYVNIPYNLHIAKEAYYHSLFLMLEKATGIEVNSEVLTNVGRIDVVLKHKDFVVVIEIKYSKDNNKVENMLKEGMIQIRSTKYYERYRNNNPILLSIVFSENKEIACKFEDI
ncbi:MAG: PD-(D/E)XK nuclease domain-containing protein [Endomicrobium sp.]|nr:PD-(D/E)XK nuclease domain-containing protein [Endomicrobium sp.]